MSKCQEHVVQRVCVPAIGVCVSICAHECLSWHWWACMCRSSVFYAASSRLDADMSVWLLTSFPAPYLLFSQFFTCWSPSRSLPSGKDSFRLSDWPRNYHLLFSSPCLFSLCPSFLSSISLALPLLGVQAQTEREKSWQWGTFPCFPPSASTSPPLYPTARSPLPLCFFLSSFLPLHYFALSSSPFSRHLSLSASLLPLSIIFPPLCSALLSLPLLFFLVHNM